MFLETTIKLDSLTYNEENHSLGSELQSRSICFVTIGIESRSKTSSWNAKMNDSPGSNLLVKKHRAQQLHADD
jgi:hypothetical protein